MLNRIQWLIPVGCGLYALGMPVMMVPGHGVGGTATTKQPPSWGPHMEHTYSFKNWARDISLWTMVTELLAEKQAVAVVLQLK
eukprot:6675761-Prorocentrum_lima.AAC.1